MLSVPAFIQIDLLNGTRLSGRFVRYADPEHAYSSGAFIAEDAEGVKTYILWAAILRVTVFPLSVQPQATPLEESS